MDYISAIIPITLVVLGLILIISKNPKMIAGYKEGEVKDPKGLAIWVGANLIIMAALWLVLVLIMKWQGANDTTILMLAPISLVWLPVLMIGSTKYNK